MFLKRKVLLKFSEILKKEKPLYRDYWSGF